MASMTQKTKSIRKRKRTAQGKERKRAAAKGTTPRFPIHLEDQPDATLPQPPGSTPAPPRKKVSSAAGKPASRKPAKSGR